LLTGTAVSGVTLTVNGGMLRLARQRKGFQRGEIHGEEEAATIEANQTHDLIRIRRRESDGRIAHLPSVLCDYCRAPLLLKPLKLVSKTYPASGRASGKTDGCARQ
jgi:hypothetical protein